METETETETEKALSKTVPGVVGSVIAFAGPSDKIPSNWVPCDGRELLQSKYQDLFDKIGLTYSRPGHLPAGTTTAPGMFRVPNLGSRVVVGTGQETPLTLRKLGDKGGTETQDLQPIAALRDGQEHWTTFAYNLENGTKAHHTTGHTHDINLLTVQLLPPFMSLTYIICVR